VQLLTAKRMHACGQSASAGCRATTKFGSIGKSQVYKKQVQLSAGTAVKQGLACNHTAQKCFAGHCECCVCSFRSLGCLSVASTLACGHMSRLTCSCRRSQGVLFAAVSAICIGDLSLSAHCTNDAPLVRVVLSYWVHNQPLLRALKPETRALKPETRQLHRPLAGHLARTAVTEMWSRGTATYVCRGCTSAGT
jgi:hypothetical protein